MVNLDNVKHIKDKFFDTKGEVVKIEDSQGRIIWKKAEAPVGDRLQGTWVWNDALSKFSTTSHTLVIMNFSSNSKDYTFLDIYSNVPMPILATLSLLYHVDIDNYDRVYETLGWKDEAYKTININTKYDDMITKPESEDDAFLSKEEFMNWLEANATKIA